MTAADTRLFKTLLACAVVVSLGWVGVRIFSPPWPDCGYSIQRDLRVIVRTAELYQHEFDELPESIEDLQARGVARLERITDPWGRPYRYALESGKPVAFSLGRDGKPGGEGEDRDRVFPGAGAVPGAD